MARSSSPIRMLRYLATLMTILGWFTTPAMASDIDLSELGPQIRKQVEAACYFSKVEGADAYDACLERELDKRDIDLVLPLHAEVNDRRPTSSKPTWRTRGKALAATGFFQQTTGSVHVVLVGKNLAEIKAGEIDAQGSAVAISEDTALTNCHVFEGGEAAIVLVNDKPVPAKLGIVDEETDRCFIRVSPADAKLRAVRGIRSIDTLKVGERVYTIGTPSGLENSLGEGVVSGLRDDDGIQYVQTTAPISPGSSGGGLFDASGNLIGITTFLLEDSQNLNFAIGADQYWR